MKKIAIAVVLITSFVISPVITHAEDFSVDELVQFLVGLDIIHADKSPIAKTQIPLYFAQKEAEKAATHLSLDVINSSDNNKVNIDITLTDSAGKAVSFAQSGFTPFFKLNGEYRGHLLAKDLLTGKIEADFSGTVAAAGDTVVISDITSHNGDTSINAEKFSIRGKFTGTSVDWEFFGGLDGKKQARGSLAIVNLAGDTIPSQKGTNVNSFYTLTPNEHYILVGNVVDIDLGKTYYSFAVPFVGNEGGYTVKSNDIIEHGKYDACPLFQSKLMLGSQGKEVEQLQAFLTVHQGYVAQTGYFGASTEARLKEYQAAEKIQVTGIVDEATQARINGSLACPNGLLSLWYPTGDESYRLTDTIHVEWYIKGLSPSDTARIYLGKETEGSGTSYELMATVPANDGRKDIALADYPHLFGAGVNGATFQYGDFYIIYIEINSSIYPNGVFATAHSDRTFSIVESRGESGQPSLTVTSPNNGENLKRGTTQKITWNSNQPSQNVNIELRRYPLRDRPLDAIVIANDVPNTGSYSWKVGEFLNNDPQGGKDGSYLMEVCTTGVGGVCDQSDSVVTIATGGVSNESTVEVGLKSDVIFSEKLHNSLASANLWLKGSPHNSAVTSWVLSADCPTDVTVKVINEAGKPLQNLCSEPLKFLTTTYADIDPGVMFATVDMVNNGSTKGSVKFTLTAYNQDNKVMGSATDTVTLGANPTTSYFINVTYPNGGEKFMPSAASRIYFTTNLPVGTPYEVALIGKAYDDTFYHGTTTADTRQIAYMTVPEIKSGEYRIRVAVDGTCGGSTVCVQDQSDANFTISPAAIVVASSGSVSSSGGTVSAQSNTSTNSDNNSSTSDTTVPAPVTQSPRIVRFLTGGSENLSITAGWNIKLVWEAADAKSCTNTWDSSTETSGVSAFTTTPSVTAFTLTCVGASGETVAKTLNVTVKDPVPATE